MVEEYAVRQGGGSAVGGAFSPPRPALYSWVSQLCGERDATVAEVAHAIATEPAAAACIVTVANASFTERGRRIASVADAVRALGLDGTRELLLTLHVHRLLRGAGPGEAPLWRHAVGTAVAARELAGLLHPPEGGLAEPAYCAAVLHTLGRTVTGPLADGGADVAAAWGLSGPVCDAIRHHREPSRARLAPRLAAIVHAACPAAAGVLTGAADPEGVELGTAGFSAMGWTQEEFSNWVRSLSHLSAAAEEIVSAVEAAGTGAARAAPQPAPRAGRHDLHAQEGARRRAPHLDLRLPSGL